tara:strand:+ start:1234 stop:1488 length:255 start_codon:yes stop_codon:yes gene_type:complete
MKQQNLSKYMLTDFYYLQEKIHEMREMVYCDDLDELFDRVPSGTKTRNDIVKDLDQARESLTRAALALLSINNKRRREVDHVFT